MPTRRVIFSEQSVADLTEIHGYISRSSPQNADETVRRLVARIEALADTIATHTIVGTSRSKGTPVQRVIERPFLIYVTVLPNGEAVEVLNIDHGSRRPRRSFD